MGRGNERAAREALREELEEIGARLIVGAPDEPALNELMTGAAYLLERACKHLAG